MKRTFIETSIFETSIKNLSKSDPDLLVRIQQILLEDPKAGDVITGTGGARKLRVPAPGKGKSGGYRTIYYDFTSEEEIYLLAVYGKGKQEDLTSDEKKKIAQLIKAIKE